MYKYLVVILVGLFSQNVLGQIKTHRPISGNIIQNQTYTGNTPTSGGVPLVPLPRPAVVPDEITLFINRTRAQMRDGICHKEVPTASLVTDTSYGVPAGNGSNPSLSRIEVCCEGYERNPHIFKQCDPICRNGCANGICVAPDECHCLPNAVQSLDGHCLPTCPIGCGNGECLPDGTCQCKRGYILHPITRKFCIPLCSQGCTNGNCVAPDQCECIRGYALNPTNKQCQPVCENCASGRCVAPGQCVCDRGYIKKDIGCEPICTRGCNNGVCIAPDVCSCRSGFQLDPTGTNCIAHCDKLCLNGFCDGSNRCSCNSGYVLSPDDFHLCQAHCPGGCVNGFCTAPNLCICKPGFVKEQGVKGTPRCVPAL